MRAMKIPSCFPTGWRRALCAAAIVLSGLSTHLATASEATFGKPSQSIAAAAGMEPLPDYLRDRGTGIPTSLFGSFIAEDEVWVYLFYEYVLEDRFEYNPDDFGYEPDEDFLGKGHLHQALVFLGWGITDSLMLELEMSAYDHQTVERSDRDHGTGPRDLVESGLGTVEGQLRYRIMKETETWPDLYTFIGWELPFQRTKHFIGASEWELFWGLGLVKGFKWGTINLYCNPFVWLPESEEESFGSVGFDYIKRLGEHWRLVLAAESSGGIQDWSAIGEVQYHVNDRLYFKFNCGFGLTEDEPVIAPEVGVMFRF